MKLALLRFFARRPLALVALGAASLAGIAAAAVSASGLFEAPADGAADLDPRLILGRGWYDSWPQKRTDIVKFYYFGGGGFGIYEDGSSYRYAVDVFDLERQKDLLSMKFLHDGQTFQTKFTVTRCEEKPPFDLCLDLVSPPRGPKRFYGFDYGDDAARFPWGAELLERAEQATER